MIVDIHVISFSFSFLWTLSGLILDTKSLNPYTVSEEFWNNVMSTTQGRDTKTKVSLPHPRLFHGRIVHESTTSTVWD